MESAQTSHECIAHFDRPKSLSMPDFEWVDEVLPFEPTGSPSLRATERYIEVPRETRRGIRWVLAWAGALAVITIAFGILTEFAYVLAAERTLSVAARAGAMEATLPRATYQSVMMTVDRRLTQYPLLAKQ